MKTSFYPLAVICVLMTGCQTAPEVSPPSPELPPKGDIADFVIVQDFLRAVYCPSSTDVRIQIDTDSHAMPLESESNGNELKARMERISSKPGDIFVILWTRNQKIDPKDDEDYAFFYGRFDRKNGRLMIFQNTPDSIPLSLSFIEVRVRDVPRAEDLQLEVFGHGINDPADQYLEFQSTKETKVFRLRSWGIEIVEPLGR